MDLIKRDSEHTELTAKLQNTNRFSNDTDHLIGDKRKRNRNE